MKAENPCLIVYTIFNHLCDDMRFNIVLAMSTEITVFLDVQLCSLLEMFRIFKEPAIYLWWIPLK
jgi:hypothetical protein